MPNASGEIEAESIERAVAGDRQELERLVEPDIRALIDLDVAKATGAEQTELSGLESDTRADVYSLGVRLYQLRRGRPQVPALSRSRASGRSSFSRRARSSCATSST